MSTDEFLDALVLIYDYRFSRKQIFNAFNDIIVEDNQEIIPFVEEVRTSYHIAVLSNTCACHWEKVLRISSVVKLFPHLFTSFQLGVMKPDALIYKKVCSNLNVPSNHILFIDDLKENVDGAVMIGMHGIVFQNSGQLLSVFSRLKW